MGGAVIPTLARDQIIAIDDKTRRHTTSNLACARLHMVSAHPAELGVVLGQAATVEKFNEIIAIPQLLRTFDVAGCIVVIDAMCTQTAIASEIHERQDRYELCVKDNQPKLFDSTLLELPWSRGGEPVQGFRDWRAVLQSRAITRVRSLAVVERTRIIGGKTTPERGHCISSRPPGVE